MERSLKKFGKPFTVNSDGEVWREAYIDRAGKRQRRRKLKLTPRAHGYITVGTWFDGSSRPMYAHRLVAEAFLPDFREDLEVDHIDGNRANNAVENLRMSTTSQNNRAHRRKSKGASSQYRGVCWHKKAKKWAARIKVDGNSLHLGLHDCEHEAAKAYNAKALELGFFPEATNQVRG